jgi:hypothetical protein
MQYGKSHVKPELLEVGKWGGRDAVWNIQFRLEDVAAVTYVYIWTPTLVAQVCACSIIYPRLPQVPAGKILSTLSFLFTVSL